MVRFLFQILQVFTIATFLNPIATSLASTNSAPNPVAIKYQVKPKDHLAEILRSMGFQNLWGKNGMVARTIKANEKLSKNSNELEPGTWITIPSSVLPDGSSFEIVDGEARKKSSPHFPQKTATPLPPSEPETQQADQTLSITPAITPAISTSPAEPSTPLPQIPESISTKPIEPKSNDKISEPTTAAERPSSGKLEETLPEQPIPTPRSRDISQLPFMISPQVSYISSLYQFGGSRGAPNLSGYGYAARIGYSYRRADWAYLIDLSYRIGQQTTTESSGDFIFGNMMDYGAGISYRNWTLRLGVSTLNMTDANRTSTFKFSDQGYYSSLAYSFFFNARTSFSLEGKTTVVNFAKVNNNELTGDAQAIQVEVMATFDYRFAIW